MDAEAATRRGFNPRDFDLGHKLRLVDGEHDVFGDGSVVCLPTHGHTPGHQSLRLRLDSGDIVLAADACYFCRTLRERRLPRYVHDKEAMLASLDRLEALERGGARHLFRSRSGILADRAAGACGRSHETAARHPVRSRRHDAGRLWAGAVTMAAHDRRLRRPARADRAATVIVAAIQAASTELWADPARHKYWRHRIGEARRQHRRDRLCRACGGRPCGAASEAVGDAMADAYNDPARRRIAHVPRRARDARPAEGAWGQAGADHQRRGRAAAREGRAVRPRTPLRPHPDRGRARLRQARGARLYSCDGGARGRPTGDLDGRRQSRMGSRRAAAPRHLRDLARRLWLGLPPGSPIRPDRIIRGL